MRTLYHARDIVIPPEFIVPVVMTTVRSTRRVEVEIEDDKRYPHADTQGKDTIYEGTEGSGKR